MGNKYPKITYDIVKQEFEKEGYQLLSKEYINNNRKLDFICPNGHKHKITRANWTAGKRCGKCSKYSKNITINFIKNEFKNIGYKLLTTNWINNKTPLDFICSNGHKHKMTWNDWTHGNRCGKCHYITYEQVKNSFEVEGYQLLSTEYKHIHAFLNYLCPNGHKGKMIYSSWKRGSRCPKCSMNGISKPEKEILEFVKKNYNGVIKENDRTTILNPITKYPLELDIWLPELKKAIEYNSNYWHDNKESIKRDNYKQQWCKENNIELLIITHDNWIKNKNWNIINDFIKIGT